MAYNGIESQSYHRLLLLSGLLWGTFMSHGPMPGRDEHDRFFDQVVSQYDVPAFVRRGRRVQEAYQDLLEQCRAQRAEWLPMPALRLGQLAALATNLDLLVPLLSNADQVNVLRQLQEELNPQLRVPVAPATSRRQLRVALDDLCESIDRFNRRCLDYLANIDLTLVNGIRADYNRYYLLEKECSMRSPVLARMGFRPLQPLTHDDLKAELPPLPIPKILRG
jgi:hypothetical protein